MRILNQNSFGILGLCLILLVWIVLAQVWPQWSPLYGSGYDFPQHVVTSEVEVGGFITVDGVMKCNRDSHSIVVASAWTWRKVANSYDHSISTVRRVGRPRPSGCLENPRTYRNTLPPEVTPGLWVLTGLEQPIGYINLQNKQVPRIGAEIKWETETFRVLPNANLLP